MPELSEVPDNNNHLKVSSSQHVQDLSDDVASNGVIFGVVCHPRGERGDLLGHQRHGADLIGSDRGQDPLQFNQYLSEGPFTSALVGVEQ